MRFAVGSRARSGSAAPAKARAWKVQAISWSRAFALVMRTAIAAGLIGALFAIAVKASGISHEPARFRSLAAPSSFATHFGDMVTFKPLDDVKITLYSGNYPILRSFVPADHFYVFHATGDDTYTIKTDPLAIVRVRIEPERAGTLAPLVPVSFGFAFLVIGWYAFPFYRWARSGIPVVWPEALAVIAFALVAAYAFPPYLHNDEIGGGVRADWGYLAWGYADTIDSIVQALHFSGPSGLVTATSMTKPLLTPALAVPLSRVTTALVAAQIISACSMAICAFGLLTLGRMLFSPLVGRFAAASFCLAPMYFAYATSFYQETGYLASMIWALIFVRSAERTGSRMAFFGAALAIPMAVAAKGLPVIVLILALVFFTMPWLSKSVFVNARGMACYALFGLFGTIAMWPFLWRDFAFRLGYAFGSRVAYDGVIGVSVPLSTRVHTSIVDTIIHQDPITIALLVCAAVVTLIFRDRPRLYLWTCFAISVAFLLPTSQYLEHYVLYALGFAGLLAGSVWIAVPRRAWLAVPALILQFSWSALYYPYPAMARVGCLDIGCSTHRYGLAEPVYGLREATLWVREHEHGREAIGALATPHIIQAWLPNRRVYSVWLGSDAAKQTAALRDLPARFLIGNVMSDQSGQRVLSPFLKLLYRGEQRYGDPVVYENLAYKARWKWLDPPAPKVRLALLNGAPLRAVGFVAPWGSFDPLTYFPLIRPDPTIFGWRDFSSLIHLGGDLLLVNDPRQVDPLALGYGFPYARDGSAVAYPIPTVDGLRTIAATTLTRSAQGRHFVRALGKIVVDPRTAYATDILAVDFTSPVELDWHSYAEVDASCVFGKFSTATAVPTGRFTRTAYFVMASDPNLKSCRDSNTEIYLVATFAHIDPTLSYPMRARLVWGKFLGDVRTAPSDAVALSTTKSGPAYANAADDDAVRDWTRHENVTGVVMPPPTSEFRLEHDGEFQVTRTAKVLRFVKRDVGPDAYKVSGPFRFCKHCKLTHSCTIRFNGRDAWVTYRWYLPTKMSSPLVGLWLGKYSVATPADIEVLSGLPPQRYCRYFLGKDREGRTFFLHLDRMARDGCTIAAGTSFQLTIYRPKIGDSVTANPELFVETSHGHDVDRPLTFVPGHEPTAVDRHKCFEGTDVR